MARLRLGLGRPARHSFHQPATASFSQVAKGTVQRDQRGQARPPAWYPWMNVTCTVLLPMFVIFNLPESPPAVPPRGGGTGGGLRLPPNTAAALAIACSAPSRARRQSQTCCEACGSAAAAVCSGGAWGKRQQAKVRGLLVQGTVWAGMASPPPHTQAAC